MSAFDGRSRLFGTAVMLMGFWVLLTGRFTVANLALGLVVAGALTYFNRELVFSYSELPRLSLHNTWTLARHTALLVFEIIKANWIMARIVLSPRPIIDPGLVILRPQLTSDVLKVLLANSISLTPGTLTLDVEGDVFTIHHIDLMQAPSLAEWKVERLLESVREVEP